MTPQVRRSMVRLSIYIFGWTTLNPDLEPEMSDILQKNGAIEDDRSLNSPSVSKTADDELPHV